MRFEDFHAGQIITGGPHRVGEREILEFARAWDPQWFHADVSAAALGPFAGLIASGWHTCSVAMRLIVSAALAGSEAYASPGVEDIRWPSPVRSGDELRLRAQVLEVRRSKSRAKIGVLRWRWQLHNQDGVEVLELTATSLFRLSETDRSIPERGQC